MEEKRALLTVSFGTAAEEARRVEIGGVEEALRRRVPELPFARAYTSPTIRRILANRGIAVPSLEEALEEQLSAGVEQLYLLPTHLLPGYEYDAIAATVESFRPRFRDLRLAPPLMGDTDMVRALAGVLMERWRKLLGQTVVLVGHGTTHPGNLVYPALQGVLSLAGRGDILVGAIEGWPGLDELLPVLERQGAERVILAPLLLTAGGHRRPRPGELEEPPGGGGPDRPPRSGGAGAAAPGPGAVCAAAGAAAGGVRILSGGISPPPFKAFPLGRIRGSSGNRHH